MRIIGGIGSIASPARVPRRGTAEPREADAPPAESRALIRVEAPTASDHAGGTTQRPLAAFLAHLIATHTQAPQTRARRRVQPEEAANAYAATIAMTAGIHFRRRDG